MTKTQIAGTVVRFTFDDGPMAGKTFEHSFGVNGTVTFRQLGAGGSPAKEKTEAKDSTGAPETKYEAEAIREDIVTVSYRSAAGYTLTAILDFETHRLVAFSSNEKMHLAQHGTFEVAPADETRSAPASSHPAGASRPGGRAAATPR